MGKEILEKDRSQLLRMAGNIAAGLISSNFSLNEQDFSIDEHEISSMSASIAYKTMIEVDYIIEMENKAIKNENTNI